MPQAHPPPWRFSISSTLRGIYVIRYFLFAGGLAIAGALIQRAAVGEAPPVLGLLLGFGAGLLLFRGQLRPLSWPTLVLSQQAIYLLQRKGPPTVLPWASVEEISHGEGKVYLRVRGSPLELEARKYGTSADALGRALRQLADDPQLRLSLPSREQLGRMRAIAQILSEASPLSGDRG